LPRPLDFYSKFFAKTLLVDGLGTNATSEAWLGAIAWRL
jgi:hypothetical protein